MDRSAMVNLGIERLLSHWSNRFKSRWYATTVFSASRHSLRKYSTNDWDQPPPFPGFGEACNRMSLSLRGGISGPTKNQPPETAPLFRLRLPSHSVPTLRLFQPNVNGTPLSQDSTTNRGSLIGPGKPLAGAILLTIHSNKRPDFANQIRKLRLSEQGKTTSF